MAKRIIGVVAALAIIVIVIFTALGCGSYKSMLPDDLFFGSGEVVEQVVDAAADNVSAEVGVE